VSSELSRNTNELSEMSGLSFDPRLLQSEYPMSPSTEERSVFSEGRVEE